MLLVSGIRWEVLKEQSRVSFSMSDSVLTSRPLFSLYLNLRSLTTMPGLDFFSKRTKHRSRQPYLNVKVDGKGSAFGSEIGDTPSPSPSPSISPSVSTSDPDVYYNARLDPQNYLEGPLSWNPATRLRQMLARPGIVVRTCNYARLLPEIYFIVVGCPWYLRRHKCTMCSRSRLRLFISEVG